MFARPVRLVLGVLTSGALASGTSLAAAAEAGEPSPPPVPPTSTPSQPAPGSPEPPKRAEAIGYGGAVSSVDTNATRAGLEVLRQGGNASDAAVAVAAALGVTEPYSAGVGGGGYFEHYDARTGEVDTIDGRETAPAAARSNLFLDERGQPIPSQEAITSGLSVGVPGTPLTWQDALRRWGEKDLSEVLRPAEHLAEAGFTVDPTFRDQTAENQARFSAFPATRQLFLPGGKPPEVGGKLRNPDLAQTYRTLGTRGLDAFYRGRIGADIADTVRRPPVAPAAELRVRPGGMSGQDLSDYRTRDQQPTHVNYRGLDVYGMAPSGSGGTTIGEALNVLKRTDLSTADPTAYLHRFLEASKIGFADRDRWVGDPHFSEVPTQQLLDQRFADSRECLITPKAVLPPPVAPADPRAPRACQPRTSHATPPREGPNTTHLTVADARGDVVSYTLTNEQTGGNGMVVPHRGFFLNNELTDFSKTPNTPGVPDPNLPGPGKRPRSSMSPTMVLRDGRPVLATGSPGGSTIITTVLQVLAERIDRHKSLLDAIAEPRASQRNSAHTEAEPGFLARPEADKLRGLGHRFEPSQEIGAATGVERLPDGRWVAAAEPQRRGGGAAGVVLPDPVGRRPHPGGD